MASVYIETSIVSYLRQQPSGQVVAAAHQLLTHRWWNYHRHEYDLVTSQYVLEEAALGDSSLAAERLKALADIPSLELHPEIPRLATEIVAQSCQARQLSMLFISRQRHATQLTICLPGIASTSPMFGFSPKSVIYW